VHAHLRNLLLESGQDDGVGLVVFPHVVGELAVVEFEHQASLGSHHKVWAPEVFGVPEHLVRLFGALAELVGERDRTYIAAAFEVELALYSQFAVLEADSSVVDPDYDLLVYDSHHVQRTILALLARLFLDGRRVFLVLFRQVDDLQH